MQSMAIRDDSGALTRHLVGTGIEVGPGHHPLVASNEWLTVRYADRWEPDRNTELFPELEGAVFPKPDLVVDLNRNALQPVASQSEDFIVCSHLLEHLANPLRAITDFHRVLRPGGTLLILLPDRRRTFDKGRPPTPIEHVIADFEAGVVEVDDDHIMEFLANVGVDVDSLESMPSRDRAEMFELHRRRSIHVHCWTLEEFVPILRYAIEYLGNEWQFVDGVTTEDLGPESIEFGLVLRRCPTNLSASSMAALFTNSFESWLAARTLSAELRRAADEQTFQIDTEAGRFSGTMAPTQDLETQLKSANQTISELNGEIKALLSTKTFRYSSHLRQVYRAIRSRLLPNGRFTSPN